MVDSTLEINYSLWQAVCNFSSDSFMLNGMCLPENEHTGCIMPSQSIAETLQYIYLCGGQHFFFNSLDFIFIKVYLTF